MKPGSLFSRHLAVRAIIIALMVLAIADRLLPTSCFSGPDEYIRVGILQDVPDLSIKIDGFFEIIDVRDRKVLYRGRNLQSIVIADKDGILVGNIKSAANRLILAAGDVEAIVIDGRKFRGNIELLKKDNSRLAVINHIGLEDYVKGILYHEASHYWPQEALKAQAVVSRTYAAYQMQENKLKDYDVTRDVYSQVYGGKTSERYRTNKAVDDTAGEVLTYKNKIFPAYFHATCGGHTLDASLVWNIDLVPLRGVKCNFCQDSPHFSWHAVLPLSEIEDKLAGAGYKLSQIKGITILGRDRSGRIADLEITAARGGIKISAKDFRSILGPNLIKSTNFKAGIINRDALFEGFGWGHGVGLCQWGAYFMAKRGDTYERILKYYYPQADVKTIGF